MAQVEVEGAQKDHKLKAGNPVSVCTLQYLILYLPFLCFMLFIFFFIFLYLLLLLMLLLLLLLLCHCHISHFTLPFLNHSQ